MPVLTSLLPFKVDFLPLCPLAPLTLSIANCLLQACFLDHCTFNVVYFSITAVRVYPDSYQD